MITQYTGFNHGLVLCITDNCSKCTEAEKLFSIIEPEYKEYRKLLPTKKEACIQDSIELPLLLTQKAEMSGNAAIQYLGWLVQEFFKEEES